ncbi:fructose-bisphosphate aldolase, class I [Enteropsectra breve]|nr:fructose-bisphosphate aldolase, class I [Enteropsectra breve]
MSTSPIAGELPEHIKSLLQDTVNRIFSDGKGILALDERSSTLESRFQNFSIENTTENRNKFREIMIAMDGIEECIGGTILNVETLDQKDSTGRFFRDVLQNKGIEIGLKADLGLETYNDKAETTSKGLESFEKLLTQLSGKNITFLKWRSVYRIDSQTPSPDAIDKNSVILSTYAAVAQQNSMMPIIEPEIAYDGEYSLEEFKETAVKVYSSLIKQCMLRSVYLPGVVLKISFPSAGKDAHSCLDVEKNGNLNIEILKASVPDTVGRVVFLSGGHSTEAAIELLTSMQENGRGTGYYFSFSFARALSNSVLCNWKGRDENIGLARKEFFQTAKRCRDANR